MFIDRKNQRSNLHGRSDVREFLLVLAAFAVDAASAREVGVVGCCRQIQRLFLLTTQPSQQTVEHVIVALLARLIINNKFNYYFN